MTDKAETFDDCSACGSDFTKGNQYDVLNDTQIVCKKCQAIITVPRTYKKCYLCNKYKAETEKTKAQLSWFPPLKVKPFVTEVSICKDCLEK